MADFTAITFSSNNTYGYTTALPYDGYAEYYQYAFSMSYAESGALPIYQYYLMRWQDTDCLPTITYRTWTVVDSPDPTGIHYTGIKCGVTAISGAVVAATWSELG